ncbi:MAG: tripartite tricarboxylate transporter substrate binding protein [Betaproteobacteria bacterium]|nr:tripartite tricarboxylate transporter substrate binding protein [Betaproteobacteria bacterium]MDH3436832.1 tripartite tricarboxylate transporter substrate binding protein [Betaproteobacteria bacterium]
MQRQYAVAFGAVLTAACLIAAPAQAFTPDRTIEFMVHSGPGAGNDIFARAVQGLLEKTKLAPQSIQVVNKTGGGGLVAMSYLNEKKSESNLLAVFTSVWFVNPQIRKKAKVTMQDLTPIARLILEPSVMTVRADKPWKTAKDFFDAAKANPGKLKQSGGSLSGRDNTTRHLLMKASGAEWQFISMKSGGERVAALLGGHVDMYIMEPAEAIEQIRAGKVRVLATLMKKRIPSLPNVPTITEQGYDIPEVPQARGFVGPPGMTPDVKSYYVGLFTKLHASPEWKGFVKENLYEDGFLTGQELDKFVNEYTQQMRSILKEAGIKLVR